MNRDTGSMMSDIVYTNPPPAKFRIVSGTADLQPTVNEQPKYRRANPDGGFISPLSALTMHLATTYRLCNDKFTYESSRNPRRCLTKPGKGLKNEGFDNEDSDYILFVNDFLGIDQGHKYISCLLF
jgi:dual specificity protein kinase YAK1